MSAWQLLCVTLNIFRTSSCSTAAGWDGSASRPGCRLVFSWKLSSLLPQRSQHYSNSCESNSSCFTASSWWHRKIMDKPRKTWENHGTTPEIPGKKRGMSVFQKCLSVIFRSHRVPPGFRKSLRGDSFKSPSNLGKSWKITSFKLSWSSQTVGYLAYVQIVCQQDAW